MCQYIEFGGGSQIFRIISINYNRHAKSRADEGEVAQMVATAIVSNIRFGNADIGFHGIHLYTNINAITALKIVNIVIRRLAISLK